MLTRRLPQDTPYESFVSDKSALKGARFAMPWKRVWELASEKEYPYNIFMKTIDRIRDAGAEVYEHVDFPSAEDIISPGKWDWNYPDDPAKSELTVVKVDFYNDLKDYLASLAENPLSLKGVEDIIEFNKRHPKEEGAWPDLHGAWPTGQDTFHHVAETRGRKDDTYKSALAYIRQKSREEGIDAVINAKGEPLDGILIPIQVDSGVANQVAAKAGASAYQPILHHLVPAG
ncbi:unnamed protein product [Parascedosporium putredinis]|uniref:Amidase n=1 Tax=Parascedosporium putredinis TaxID=1442378 RepID=A0A9P1H257_9PEZI|nr:unnamed protein product [Parascedosporium putredinis]CAI7993415.1 unnamed protein product [Parascedosporium putredinis]